MIWLTWRQHRIEILIMGLVLLCIAPFLLINGIHIAADAQKAYSCTGTPTACNGAMHALSNDAQQFAENSSFFILALALPLLAGIFVGGHAIAREFEQGTYRMIWTQGTPWARWILNRIGLLCCIILCAFGLWFGLLACWAGPNLRALQDNGNFTFANIFDIWGIVPIAYALFALMLGICAGTITRKTVPAMAITLVVFVAVRILIVNFARPYYLPPVVLTTSLVITNTPPDSSQLVPPYSWVIKYTVIDRQGQTVSQDALDICNELLGSKGGTDAEQAQYNRCIIEHGFQNRSVYQPAERYWLFQAIESGIYLLLSALLLALTLWWTKHRIIRA